MMCGATPCFFEGRKLIGNRVSSSLYGAKLETFSGCHSVITKFDDGYYLKQNIYMQKWKEDKSLPKYEFCRHTSLEVPRGF